MVEVADESRRDLALVRGRELKPIVVLNRLVLELRLLFLLACSSPQFFCLVPCNRVPSEELKVFEGRSLSHTRIRQLVF